MNILITAKCHDFLLNTFHQHNHHVQYLPNIDYPQLENLIPQFEGLVITTRLKIDANILQKASRLKWIGRLGSGLELIDLATAKQKNITCFSTPEGNAQAVAEHAVGMLLALINNIPKSHHEVLQHQWLRDANRGSQIHNKTIAIIGYGHTGSAFAKCLSGFQPLQILAHDKYKKNFSSNLVSEASLDTIFNSADILSLHLPLTPETFYYCNQNFINQFKKPIILINTSRGQVLNTQDLVIALSQNRIHAAALDVLENENPSSWSQTQKNTFNALSAFSNRVLFTPHIAGYSHEAFFEMSNILIQKLKTANLL